MHQTDKCGFRLCAGGGWSCQALRCWLSCLCPSLYTDEMHHHGPSVGLRRQSWGQMLSISRLSTASQWPSGQVLMLGEQVEKFLVIPVMEHRAGCHPTWAYPIMV